MANPSTPARKPAAKRKRQPAPQPEPKPLEAHLEDICGRLASGQSLRSICKEIGIGESTVRWWLSKDEEALKQVQHARELGCDALGDECIEIADGDVAEPVDVQNKRVRIDTRLRLMGKWSQRYADKVLQQHSGGLKIERVERVIVDPAKLDG